MEASIARILVVDDSPDTREMLQRKLAAAGFRVFTAADVPQAMGLLERETVELVVTDFKMPGANGLELVRHVRENLPATEVMMVTGFATVSGAVEAVKCGAEEYLPKPFTDEELLAAVERALEKRRRRRLAHEAPAVPLEDSWGLLGDSPPMRMLLRAVQRAAESSATVLISGESGTGKELVARAIHQGSPRAGRPFVPVNCGAIPEDLLESELFGHARGAFTGALETRPGLFQAAHGGTIFLDEVGETSMAMQVKLLRVLQDKTFTMVGALQPQSVDVRILAATNQDLATAVSRGAFREDLFYRLNVLAIGVPPLRERGDDILVLAHHFLETRSRELGRPAPRLSDAALAAFLSHDWPGNVREMENLVQRLVVMHEGQEIGIADLPSAFRSPIATPGPQRSLAEVEVEHIRRVLESVGGNKSRAARILGIDRKTLREKLKQLDLGD